MDYESRLEPSMTYYLRGFDAADYGRRMFSDLFFDLNKDGVICVFRNWVDWHSSWRIKCS